MIGLLTTRCRYCQKEIKETDRVCPFCGEKFPEDEPPVGTMTAKAYKRLWSGDTTPKAQGESENKKSCFIATAAYGSDMAQEVVLLRNWRDSFLLKKRVGKNFVSFYYNVSPHISEMVSKSELLKRLVRLGLTPIIYQLKEEN